MDLRQYFEIATSALLANKLRSALTMLGVIIGVTAVVALISIGEGASAAITDQIEGAGANVIVVLPTTSLQLIGSVSNTNLTLADSDAIIDQVDHILAISPEYHNTARVTFEDASEDVLIYGTTAEQAFVRNLNTIQGRFLNDTDNEDTARVAVLGPTTAENLFGGLDPIGRDIRINGIRFEVVGVTAHSGGSTPLVDQDARVFVPLNTAYRKLFGGTTTTSGDEIVSAISISAASSDDVNGIMADITTLLYERHDIKPDESGDFSVVSQQDLLSVVSEVTNILTVFLAAIASVSLLVGGIGIMNISLVSVTERTREIGLRKAVGAKRLHILAQFLIETIALSTTGGVIGIILSVLLIVIVNQTGLITAALRPDAALLGMGFSILVGVFFGIYPANRAAQLHPIEALRYE
jgi:putative ABC transport system permease protein